MRAISEGILCEGARMVKKDEQITKMLNFLFRGSCTAIMHDIRALDTPLDEGG